MRSFFTTFSRVAILMGLAMCTSIRVIVTRKFYFFKQFSVVKAASLYFNFKPSLNAFPTFSPKDQIVIVYRIIADGF